jgi:uncharacterized membrane protein (UPF0127 family)
LARCKPNARVAGISRFVGHNPGMKSMRFLLFWLITLTSSWAFAQDQPQLDLPRVAIGAGMHRIDAQVALTPDQRQIGLMHRPEMPPHEGMLFVFEEPARQCFWMKNTLLPLSAAFVADDGSIVNLVDMKPQTTDSHCSVKPVRYVLEMNQGWFAKKAIKAGFKLTGKPFAATR